MKKNENLRSFHPKDTCDLGINRTHIENFALRFTHFLTIEEEEKKRQKTGKYKIKFPEDCDRLPEKSQAILNELHKRQESSLAELNQQHELRKLSAKIDWRMVIGLGGAHVLETSMTLHHTYGIPYIPGSAVKGITRNIAIAELCEELENTEQPDIIDKLFEVSFAELEKLETPQKKWDYVKEIGRVNREKKPYFPQDATITKILEGWSCFQTAQRVFGSQGQSGAIIFLDAFPVGNVMFTVDIMNPHYPKYYQGTMPPNDCQDPTPIPFLTIENTAFDFYLFLKERRGEDAEKELLTKTTEWLQAALQMNGIGAKSAVGYGYFDNVTDQTTIFLAELDKEREQAEQAAARLRWELLSEVDRLCEELTTLKDENRGYVIFQQWEKMEGEDKKKVAAALKQHWQSIGKWSGKITEKQKKKVEKIKATLGE
jgi:CRISPR-associated protein Cmr6